MTIYVSPAERSAFHKSLGTISSIPEEYGLDFFWVGSGGKLWGVQRKAFPADLRSSLDDGRLAKELNQMTLVDEPWFIFEGHRSETDGFSTAGLTAIETRLHLDGIGFSWTRDERDTATRIQELFNYSQKDDKLSSLRRRPRGPKDEWGKADRRLTQMWILESWPKISQVRAAAIIDWFDGLPLTFTRSRAEMMEVPGLGPKIVESMYELLEELPGDHVEAQEVRVD